MGATDYTPPVSQLLTLGETGAPSTNPQDWRNYLELGLGPENISDLIRLATDLEIYDNWDDEDEDSMVEFWGPLHAWRTLGQLKAEAAIEPLLSLFKTREDDEWAGDEVPVVYGMIGPKAIPTLAEYLAENNTAYWPPIQASRSLKEIGLRHPETRAEVVNILSKQLEKAIENDSAANAFIITDLMDLKAAETLPIIEQAFEAGDVDESIVNLDDVLVAFGLKSAEELQQQRDAAFKKRLEILSQIEPSGILNLDTPPNSDYLPLKESPMRQKTKAEKDKAKAKRKMAKASRKKNRKK